MRYDAIYSRQSVDRVDSISIESQIEYCRYETRGRECQIYQDKGYSGKNTQRPQFQEMLAAVRQGRIGRIIVYKLDRISRSILDFATMMEELQQYSVEFVSCTEKFDTATPMGRAMLNICIVFAQLERETIQMRVRDAYVSRSRRGYYMGGRVPYGYRLSPCLIDGKKTSCYVAEPGEAQVVRLIFDLYAKPQTSYGDVATYLLEHQITNAHTKTGAWSRGRIADMVKNPIYVRSDLSIYQFYQAQGAILENAPEDFMGGNGCYLYTGEGTVRKSVNLEGQHVVLAPHEGIVAADVWLKARQKCLGNKPVARPGQGKNSWLVGKVKCGRCGYALSVKKANTKAGRYFICSRHLQKMGCEGVGGLYAGDLEHLVLGEMAERLQGFEPLLPPEEAPCDPQLLTFQLQLTQVEEEIEKLLDKLPQADQVLVSYIKKRVGELDQRKRDLLAKMEQSVVPERNCDPRGIQNSMGHWEHLSLQKRQRVADALISMITATQTDVQITWRG